jgi:hypothetical protein
MLSDSERNVLNIALEKYRRGQSEPIFVGGENLVIFSIQAQTVPNDDGNE